MVFVRHAGFERVVRGEVGGDGQLVHAVMFGGAVGGFGVQPEAGLTPTTAFVGIQETAENGQTREVDDVGTADSGNVLPVLNVCAQKHIGDRDDFVKIRVGILGWWTAASIVRRR